MSTCGWCDEPIRDDEPSQIIPRLDEDGQTTQVHYHRECSFRMIAGSLSHQLRTCSCYVKGATETDPADMTRRDAARAALTAFLLRQSLKGGASE